MRRLHDLPSMVANGPVVPSRSTNHTNMLAVIRREETGKPESNATRTRARAPVHAPGSEPAVYPREPLVRRWRPRAGSLPSKVKFREGYVSRSPHRPRPKADHLGDLASLSTGKLIGASKPKNPNLLSVVTDRRPFMPGASVARSVAGREINLSSGEGRRTLVSSTPTLPVILSRNLGPTQPAWAVPATNERPELLRPELPISRYPRPPVKKYRRKKRRKKEIV